MQTPEPDAIIMETTANTAEKAGADYAKSEKTGRTVVLVIVIILAVCLYGGAVALYGMTSVEWALPCAVGLFMAALTLKPMLGAWKWMLESGSAIFAGIAHMLAMTGVFAFLFLGINFWLADDATLHRERVELLGRDREKRHHSRRVGRHRYVRGDAYYVYHMTVRLPDGREKRIDVPLSYYNTLVRKDSVTLTLESGGLGMPVIRQK